MEILNKVKEQFIAEYNALGPCPFVERKFFAYKGGEVKEFSSFDEARKYSALTEQVTNDNDRIEWIKRRNEIGIREGLAYNAALRKHFDLSEKDFCFLKGCATAVRSTLNVDYDSEYDYEQHLADILEIMKYKMEN